MKKMFFIILIAILTFLVSSNAYSQLCPPTIEEPSWDPVRTSIFQPFGLGGSIWGTVNFQQRSIPSGYEIKVDWTSLNNHGAYGITDEEFKQMMYKTIIVDILNGDCNYEGLKDFIFYEETECMIRKKCYLHLKKEKIVKCTDTGWPGPAPETYEYNGEYYYRVFSEYSCGVQCCQLVYSVGCNLNLPWGQDGVTISSITKVPYPGSECGQSTNYDCFVTPPELNDCNSNCD